ncbi:MAG: hypothetical protein OJJ21_16685 [Ferrovibrio sp.]|uniref:hypothetical protein n=1 Tax=Ferrovibrio sp. TaxID=1917215 RepID=UPI00261EE034|nr:hypothetical protein [Ferrovibrio sp.]MCW0235239.1 hypothetical protein [Ferrovibrio sp.]
MATHMPVAGNATPVDIAHRRAPMAAPDDILAAAAKWNRQRAKSAHGASRVRYLLNATECDTRIAELRLADMREAA